MSVFIMVAVATFLLLFNIRSITLNIGKSENNQLEMLKALETIDNDTDVPVDLGVKILKVTLILILLFYGLFYITAAIIVNSTIFTLVSTVLIILLIIDSRSFFRLIDTKKLINTKWYGALISIVGIVYISYFIGFYYVHRPGYETAIWLGTIMGFVFFALMNRGKKKDAITNVPE